MKDSQAQAPFIIVDAAVHASPTASRQAHPNCFVCGPGQGRGLRLQFVLLDDGSVRARPPTAKPDIPLNNEAECRIEEPGNV